MPQRPNAQYNVAAPDSLPVRIAGRARRRMYERFLARTQIAEDETLLDVGATSDQTYESSNYVAAWYPYKHRITAVGIDDASFLEDRYPGLTFVSADGRELPFPSCSFDVVHSSAVLEHVGNAADQRRFIGELARVARRAVFLTTPNRGFPVEFHTVLPFVHWLPRRTFRRLLRDTRYAFFADENNLNLLGRRDLERLCGGLSGWDVHIEPLRLGGLCSNLLLTLRRREDRGRNASADAHENEAGRQRVGQQGGAERGRDEGRRVRERAEGRVERETVAQRE